MTNTLFDLAAFDDAMGRFDVIHSLISLFPKKKKLKLAFLGYSDLMHTNEQWKTWAGKNIHKLVHRENSEKLKAIHGRPDVELVPTISSAVEAVFGKRISVTVFDFQAYEGSEVIHDFNYQIPKKFMNEFDIVLDFGSLEHIFNAPQAIANLALMAKVEGLVFNENPLIMINHGFYSFNPTFYCDFFAENNFSIERIRFSTQAKIKNPDGTISSRGLNIKGIPESERFRLQLIETQTSIDDLAKGEFVIASLARKLAMIESISFPIQGRYRNKANWV